MTYADHDKLKAQLSAEEGIRNKIYNDSLGIPTIGIGRNLRDVGLSDAEVDFLFCNDVQAVEESLYGALPWIFDLDEVRVRVIYDLCFNIGIRRLLGFPKMLAALQSKDYDTAADELQNSEWDEQVGSRAPKLVSMLRTGEDSWSNPM